MTQSLLQRLLGHPAPEKSEPDEDVVSPFHFYQTFSLKDGHCLRFVLLQALYNLRRAGVGSFRGPTNVDS